MYNIILTREKIAIVVTVFCALLPYGLHCKKPLYPYLKIKFLTQCASFLIFSILHFYPIFTHISS